MLHRVDVDLVLQRGDGAPTPSGCRSSADTAGPGSIGSSCIQMMWPRTGRRPRRRVRGGQITSPRLTVDLVFQRERDRLPGGRVRQIAAPTALRATRLPCPTAAPSPVAGLHVPPAIRPEKPRKSRFGRLTHCTGMRNGASPRGVASTRRFRDARISAGPRYQGMLPLRFGDVVAARAPTSGSARSFDADACARTRGSRRRCGRTRPAVADQVHLVDGQHDVRMPSSDTR